MKYHNPVIPGFYPDPSVCRVGADYYLVNSSFEFFPGVPLYHSTNLVNWQQIGHVLTRQGQLPLTGCRTSGGIFAPTIRHHNGRFYMITTNVGQPLQNFIVHTGDIHGPWSDPILLDQMGIDPSLFWDDDGRCYYVGTHNAADGQCIGQFELDPDTGKRLSETRPIWYGTGGKCPEGPHMYKVNGLYYLMIAEGGTEYGHMETIARSDNVWGPFESCPHNPILTHRNLMPGYEEMCGPGYVDIQGTGHADLVEDSQGNWWLLFHAVRPTQGQLHHIGRETMLAPVQWVDGWPVVNGGKPITAQMCTQDTPGAVPGADGFVPQNPFSVAAAFTQMSRFPADWAHLRNPRPENYRFEQGLVLAACSDDLDSLGSPTFAGVRQRQFDAQVTALLEPSPQEGAQSGLTVFHTNEQHYDLLITTQNGQRQALLRKRVCDMVTETPPVTLPGDGAVRLQISSTKQGYTFSVSPQGSGPIELGHGRSQLLSTEVMAGTFTGCFFGVFAQGAAGSKARFLHFDCRY